MKGLLAFGEALIDLLQDPSQPNLYHRNAGGAPANVAVGFARLGGRAAFMGMLGADDFGSFLLAQLQHYGVATGYVRRTAAAATALAVVSLDAGERSFSFYRPPSADLRLAPGDIDAGAFTTQPYFHFCSNSLTHEPSRSATTHALALARQHGCLVSFDINHRPALWSPGDDARALVRRLLQQAHILKFSAEEWDWLCEGASGHALAAQCFGGVCELIVITDGGAAVRTMTRGAMQARHPVEPCEVVDTTAAGDAFIAALLLQFAVADLDAGMLRERLASADWLAPQIGFASRCGSLACTRFGAFSALPALEQAEHTV
jgi:fructokinase